MNKTNVGAEFISFVVSIRVSKIHSIKNESAEVIQMFNAIDLFKKVTGLNETEKKIREAIDELHAYSDRQLEDIGISRSDIEYVVRHGANDDERKGSQQAA